MDWKTFLVFIKFCGPNRTEHGKHVVPALRHICTSDAGRTEAPPLTNEVQCRKFACIFHSRCVIVFACPLTRSASRDDGHISLRHGLEKHYVNNQRRVSNIIALRVGNWKCQLELAETWQGSRRTDGVNAFDTGDDVCLVGMLLDSNILPVTDIIQPGLLNLTGLSLLRHFKTEIRTVVEKSYAYYSLHNLSPFFFTAILLQNSLQSVPRAWDSRAGFKRGNNEEVIHGQRKHLNDAGKAPKTVRGNKLKRPLAIRLTLTYASVRQWYSLAYSLPQLLLTGSLLPTSGGADHLALAADTPEPSRWEEKTTPPTNGGMRLPEDW
ncbi:uncharacterized protein CLUP02_14543 [Colletotrichum lupini]|uniref:Uncharacterized protein n=1 Tax=Colletotrichum lupini TaxID=145971 RepID=A0A9Q8WNE1_9PEZI|nr:uncharacterized protein CLUP02_14543 [Colletotrichum lupini]UQC89015.1 hypothetical protein CLUP02_14543 [Colletotrichum lupini]